jgi:hypothetical protein
VLGAPSLWFAARILVRDHGARLAAEAAPELAWGAWTPLRMLSATSELVFSSVGYALVLFALALVLAARRRDALALTAGVSALGVALGMAALTLVARIQPYYALAVIPLGLLALRTCTEGSSRRWSQIMIALMASATTVQLATAVPWAARLYEPDERAFVARFAPQLLERPERSVITVSHYDATLLGYYLARSAGVRYAHDTITRDDHGMHIEGVALAVIPLIRSHGDQREREDRALARLQQETTRSVLVLTRDDFKVARVSEFVAHCDLLAEAAGGQLYRCGPPPAP